MLPSSPSYSMRDVVSKIVLNANFDSASLDVERSRVDGDLVYLEGRANHNPGYWKWLYFRADGVQNRRPVFVIGDHFESGHHRLEEHQMVFSYDQEHWFFFDWNERNPKTGRYQFGNHDPFEQGQVYVAYGLPYPASKMDMLVAELRRRPNVEPTRSANANLALGYSPGGTDDRGHPIPPHGLYGFQITDRSASRPKKHVMLVAGVHPNETLAHHVLEGLLRFLVGPDPMAQALREHAVFTVYPMVNPDGRAAGYNRSTVQHETRDANRFWRPDLYADMDDIRLVAEAMRTDVPRVDYFVDFHCWTSTTTHFAFLADSEGFHHDPFWLALRRRAPHITRTQSGFENCSTETFAVKNLRAKFAMTFETMFIPDWHVADFHHLGVHFAHAFHDAIVGLQPEQDALPEPPVLE